MMAPTKRKRFRLPIAYTLFLAMFVQIALAVGAIELSATWNLRQGFSHFLVARDGDLLNRFAILAGKKIKAEGSLAAFRADNKAAMHEIFRTLGNELGIPPAPAGPSSRPGKMPDGRMTLRPPPVSAPDPRRFPRHSRPDNFAGRVAVFAPSGERIAGFPLERGAPTISRPVTVDGKVVAIAKATPPPPPSALDRDFLGHQIYGFSITAMASLLLAALASWFIAYRWARSLQDIEVATGRIAEGDFAVSLNERGTAEIARLIANINGMTAELRRLETARRRWLADISHELRTPVAILRGEIEALKDGVRQPNAEAIASLHEEALSITALLDDLHLVAISDIGRMRCDFEEVDARDLASRAVERFGPEVEAKNLDLQLEGDAGAVPLVCDAGRISQVLGNLLANSVKYTDAPGRIRMRVEEEEGERVVFCVEDSPPVPDAEMLNKLFVPFFRSRDSSTFGVDGSGLGLAVCKAIVEAHEGQITAEKSPLGGLRVTVRLPKEGAGDGTEREPQGPGGRGRPQDRGDPV